MPVRFRLVLEITFPEADPWDPSEYSEILEQVKGALETSRTPKCADVSIRKATTIGPKDDYGAWRGGWKYDFSSFSSTSGFVWSVAYPVPPVSPADLATVWDLLSRAERGELQEINVAVALGQRLRPESNAEAVIARVSILRTLQARNAVAAASPVVFETAATFPLERCPASESEIDALAQFF